MEENSEEIQKIPASLVDFHNPDLGLVIHVLQKEKKEYENDFINDSCVIWGSPSFSIDLKGFPHYKACHNMRAGRWYIVKKDMNYKKYMASFTEKKKAILSSWIMKECDKNNFLVLTKEALEYSKTLTPMRQETKELFFLRHLAKIPEGKMGVIYNLEDEKLIAQALPYKLLMTESESIEALDELISGLESRGHSKSYESKHEGHLHKCVKITHSGRRKITKLEEEEKDPMKKSLTQAFVALWFNKKMMNPFYEALAEGIKKSGYIPYRVDEDPSVEKIDEDLMREIEESCFIVADFSQGKEGNRGSVYFEAGFAIGKGKNRIFTCRKGTKLPFDTRNRFHIFWDYDDLDGLVEEVRKKICDGPIGRGPVPYTPDSRHTFNVPTPQED